MIRLGFAALLAVSPWAVSPGLAQPAPTSAEVDQLVAAETGNIMYRIAVDGDTVVIGLPYDNKQGKRSGSAYVYVRKSGRWARQARLLASDGQAEDQFGFAVAVRGDTAVIGAAADDGIRGSAHVFERVGDKWHAQAILHGDDTSQLFGSWIVLGDATALIGASDRTPAGEGAEAAAARSEEAAYLFTRTGTAWTRRDRLFGLTTPGFGNSTEYRQSEEMSAYERDKNLNAKLYIKGGKRWTVYVEGCLIGADERGAWLSSEDGRLLFVPYSEHDGYAVSGRCSPAVLP